MTTRAPRPCAGSPICPELVHYPDRYCPDHARAREQARGSSYERGYDARWKKTRSRYLDQLRSSDPDGLARCEECGISEQDVDLHVDHIDGLGPDGPRGHDLDNLQALCPSDHQRKTAHQTGAKGAPQ